MNISRIDVETAMGVKLNKLNTGLEYRKNLYAWGDFLVNRILRPWLHFEFLYKLFGLSAKVDKLLIPIHNFSETIINQRRKQFHQNILDNTNNNDDDDDENDINTLVKFKMNKSYFLIITSLNFQQKTTTCFA